MRTQQPQEPALIDPSTPAAMQPDPPRILLVSGPAAGGMRRHLDSLAGELPAHGFHVAMVAPTSLKLTASVEQHDLDLGDRPRPPRDLAALLALRRIVRRWQPDLVHAHGVKAALLALAAFPTGRPPVLVTFHNLWHGGPLTIPLRLLVPRAAAAIAVSAAVREGLARYGIRPHALEVIPNGLDLARFSPAPERPSSEPFTATFVGRLTKEKGIGVLMAAAELLRVDPGVRLLVAGDGPLRPEVEAAAGEKGAALSFVGHQEDVRPIYQAADVVLLPSLSEGHPMTALEAMAMGLPVVASHVGGLPEIVVEGETGLLLPPDDPAALAEALLALAGDRERSRQMGRAGRRRAEQEFSVERMLERLITLYHRVLTKARSPQSGPTE